MNSAVRFLLLVASLVALFAIHVHSLPTSMPAEEDLVLTDAEHALLDTKSVIVTSFRTKRATCDLPSFNRKWVTPNHAGCAAHCLKRGKKGGSCKNAICYCRN